MKNLKKLLVYLHVRMLSYICGCLSKVWLSEDSRSILQKKHSEGLVLSEERIHKIPCENMKW